MHNDAHNNTHNNMRSSMNRRLLPLGPGILHGALPGLLLLVGLNAHAAPTVSLTAPANAAKYYAPASLTVNASATPSSGTTLAKVEFYQGSTLIGTDTTSPYSIAWATPPAGTYTLTAKATDSAGGVTTSAARTVTITASNTPPTVSLSAPANAAKYYAPASLSLTASASGVEINTPITQVTFYANGALIGTDTTSPYSIAWATPPAGTYTLTAQATDSAGGVTTSAVRTITVSATNTAPTVSLSTPNNSAKYLAPATITVSATASGVETNTPITQVRLFDGTTVLATFTASPYSYVWTNVPVGTHTLTAQATDSAGGQTTSAVRTITVSATNLPPTVSLTAPAANAQVQAPLDVTLQATVSAPEVNDTIAKVEYYQGSTLIGTATASPWQVTWVKPAAGVYTLTAKATDGQGATKTSAARQLTVLAAAQQKLYFLHTDHLNMPRLVTDEQNKVVWRNSPLSEPFGLTPPEEDPDGDGTKFTLNLRFPGQYADKETNTNYNYYRDYNPQTGRYLQSDPIGLEGGINTYGYVFGNPMSLSDPTGQIPFAIPLIGLTSGAALGWIIHNMPGPSKPGGGDDPLGNALPGGGAGSSSSGLGQVCKPTIADVLPNDFCEQLALAEAKAGAGQPIMGLMADAPRLVALYGPGPWMKMQHTHVCANGRKVVIHYFSNGRGLNVELKFV